MPEPEQNLTSCISSCNLAIYKDSARPPTPRQALPVEGVGVILGNDLAGDRAWAEASPPNVVTQVPVPLPSKLEVGKKTAESEPEVELFPACAVTRTMGRVKDEAAQQAQAEAKVVLIPVPLKSVSHSELIQEQKSDPSVKALF